jgi:hypothetical protein
MNWNGKGNKKFSVTGSKSFVFVEINMPAKRQMVQGGQVEM